MKAIYFYDKNKQFVGSDVVENYHKLTSGQTDIEPEEGLYQPAIFDGTKWIGADKEAYEAELEKERQAYLTAHPKEPTTTDKLLADLMLKQAEQDQFNSKLLQTAKSK